MLSFTNDLRSNRPAMCLSYPHEPLSQVLIEPGSILRALLWCLSGLSRTVKKTRQGKKATSGERTICLAEQITTGKALDKRIMVVAGRNSLEVVGTSLRQSVIRTRADNIRPKFRLDLCAFGSYAMASDKRRGVRGADGPLEQQA